MHPHVEIEDLETSLERAAEIVAGAERLAVLTGAGVSAESGMRTFRGAGGLWEGEPVQEVATPQGFQRDPARVWRFYNNRRSHLKTVLPNPGHHALAELERRWTSSRFALVTQNIDGLHQAAGSSHVLELHGSLTRIRCSRCDYLRECPEEDLPELPQCPSCGRLLRPDVVWFEEMLPGNIWELAVEAVTACRAFLVIGTSALVYPAAGLIEMAIRLHVPVIEVNPDRTPISNAATLSLHGPSGEVLPKLVALLPPEQSP